MGRIRKASLTAGEAASALEQVKLMIEVVHGKCRLLCWTYESMKETSGAVRLVIWGRAEILFTGRCGSTLTSTKFLADVYMNDMDDFSALKHVLHELEVANKNYDVWWDDKEQVFEISRLADEVTYVGSGASYRWTQPRRPESRQEGLEFSI